jgi:hypothetical protein
VTRPAAITPPAPTNHTQEPTGRALPRWVSGPLARIVCIFLATRLALTLIGVLSLLLHGRMTAYRLEWEHPRQLWLDLWGQWDTGWYLDIARNWYAAAPRYEGLPNYAFFPLYPLLIRGLGALIGSHFLAGLIIANLALLGAALLLYRLVLLDHDEETAGRAVKYLFLWPTAFLLSGILTEGLFIFLLIAAFYLARRQRWLWCGLSGFFLCLTRVNGIIMLLPLAWCYLQAKEFRLSRLRADLLALALLPAGLAVVMLYDYRLTGDALAFSHAHAAWGRQFGNPLTHLLNGLDGLSAGVDGSFSAWLTTATLLLLAFSWRRLPPPYLLVCLLTIFIPLTTGLMSLPRFTAILFPLPIALALLSRRPAIDTGASAFLTLLQGFLMVFWSIGHDLVV